MRDAATITGAEVRVYRIPTDAPEADGTYSWDQTTMSLVGLASGSTKGMGYTYGGQGVATVANTLLEKIVKGKDAWRHAAILSEMRGKVRNDGETGISAMAISAIDNAFWDLRGPCSTCRW